MEKSVLVEKSKVEESPWEKKKKNMPKEEKRSTTPSNKEQNSFLKATGTRGASRWRSDFEQWSRRLTKICHTWC